MAKETRLIYREFIFDAMIRIGVSALIGVLTAIAAKMLTSASNLAFDSWFSQLNSISAIKADLGLASDTNIIVIPDATHLIYLGAALFIGSLTVSLVLKLLPNGKVSAPPDTLHALTDTDHPVSLKTGVISTAIAGISTASGASVGLYGPMIHFGGLVAEGMRRFFGTSSISWQTLVGCGVAGAISAAFLTPIGAALFATEFVMRRMNLRDFLPLAVASSTAWGVALAIGAQPVFKLDSSGLELGVGSLLVTSLLGIVLGAFTIGFTQLIEYTTKHLPNIVPAPDFSPMWAATVLFGIGAFIPNALGIGIDFIQSLFTTHYGLLALLVILIAKLIATVVCVGLRFYGGLFAPSLFVGAVVGAIFGNLVLFTPLASVSGMEAAINALPVIAAFAVASALVGAPFAAAIIILEMTQSYEVAALGFSTCVMTCYLYSGFMGRSFFDRRLSDRGLSYEAATPVRRLGVTPVIELAASLDEIKRQDTRELEELDAIIAGKTPLKLDPKLSALDAMKAMDEADVHFAELALDTDANHDNRRFLHRERIDELAWELTQTDSEANVLGAMQSRDFVSLYESNLARELTTEELSILATYGRLKVIKAGKTLLQQGDSSRSFYILNAGMLQVSIPNPSSGGNTTLAWLRSGTIVGELGFLTGEPRSANVSATTDCIVQEFRPEFIGAASEGSSMTRSLNKLAIKRGVVLKKQ